MQSLESSSTLDDMAGCCCHTFVVNSVMTPWGCIGLFVVWVVLCGWTVSHLGLGTIELHYFDLPFPSRAQVV